MNGTHDHIGLPGVDTWQGAHRAQDLLKFAPLMPLGTAGGCLVAALCLWPVLPREWALWLATGLMLALAQWQTARSIARSVDPAPRAARLRSRWVLANALAAGVFWGATSIGLFPSGSVEHQLLLAFILTAVTVLWLPFFALVRKSLLVFTVPGVLPMAFALLTSPNPPQTTMGSLLLLLIGALALVAQIGSRVLFAESAARRALQHEATHDGLVGLANRAEFHRRAHTLEVMQAHSYAMIFMDLDHFKEVNDSAGHAVGDDLLRNIGTVLRQVVRKGDTAARLGGDEFAVLMEGCGASEAAEVAATILARIRSFQLKGGERCRRITASIGIACSADLCASPARLLEAADHACYRAKRGGRNRIEIATGLVDRSPRHRNRADFALISDLPGDLPVPSA
ncbi:MAG TPA: GGDEF domain-containing protein [Gammaproteobacteria bacterium]|nr:GGDEF domain-containing protein [Gammaproteobacteria bacterium]